MGLKLYYYPLRNFGDQPLNTWLWPRLLPTQLCDSSQTLLVGIGTLLNEQLPRAPHKLIFSSGAGYGPAPMDERWHVYCVRGPATARRLGLPLDTAITDGAVLVRTLGLEAPPKTQRVAYMPHWRSNTHAGWRKICEQAGVAYVDPAASVEHILDAIQRAELLLTEALHGAVVADALRVPWVPVQAYRHILSFKWRDWCESLDLAYRPTRLPAVYQPSSVETKIRELAGGRLPAWLIAWMVAICRPLATLAFRQGTERAAAALHRLSASSQPTLSDDSTLDRVTARLLAKLDDLKRDLAAGHPDFATATS